VSKRSLKQLWELLVSGRLPHADKNVDTFAREMLALERFLAQPGGDVRTLLRSSARCSLQMS